MNLIVFGVWNAASNERRALTVCSDPLHLRPLFNGRTIILALWGFGQYAWGNINGRGNVSNQRMSQLNAGLGMEVRVGGISLFLLQNSWLLMCHSSRCKSGLWTSRADTINLRLGITCCHIKTQTTQGCWISYVVFTQKPVGFGFHSPQCSAKHYPWNVEEEVVTATLKIYRSVHSSTDCLCNTNLLADFHWALVPPTYLQPFVWMETITFLLPFLLVSP